MRKQTRVTRPRLCNRPFPAQSGGVLRAPSLPITRLHSGDVVLLQADRPISASAAGHLQDVWRARVGTDIKLVILDATWESVHVLRVSGRRRAIGNQAA